MMSRKAFAVGLLTVIRVILATTYQSVAAVECRQHLSVHYSIRNLDTNTRVGGHVWQHIAGLAAKPNNAINGDTQHHKTLFNSWNDFKQAWHSNCQANDNPQICADQNDPIADCLDADPPIINGGRRCTQVNGDNLCINSNPLTIRSYIFVYRKINGVWIMRTAYPRNVQC